MSLDLKSGDLSYADFEPMNALIFSTVLSPDRKHAYGVYTTLTSIDVRGHRLEKRVSLDHTFYAVNVSSDGREIYTGGTECDIGVLRCGQSREEDDSEASGLQRPSDCDLACHPRKITVSAFRAAVAAPEAATRVPSRSRFS